MYNVALDPAWKGLVEESWLRRIDETPFLSRCRTRQVTREELQSFVRQQYHYSRHFTRYLCALLSNLTEEADRLELAHNLFEEMGFGGFGEIPHAQIYREMMDRMGVSSEEEPVFAGTRGLIEAMLEACRNPDPLVGLGALCLGAEAIVPHVYSQIVAGFEGQGEPQNNLVFFRIHIEEDDKHAITMRKIIEKALANEPAMLLRLKSVAARVLEARARFFEGISAISERESNVAVQLG